MMPRSRQWVENTFGEFDWKDDPRRRGAIIIAADWIVHNLARVQLSFRLPTYSGRPISEITCHALIADQLLGALNAVNPACISTFDGCWVPRHMNWDPRRPLSRHSWGIAVDINAALFPYGSSARQDDGLITIFRRYGFEWGGYWDPPDPMHFEAVDVFEDRRDLKIIVNDEIVSHAGQLIRAEAHGPLTPIIEALGGTVTPHPRQNKIYIYLGRKP